MNKPLKVVIIGGVAGGMSAATRLRRLNEHAQIIVFEMGEHVSYANCGLPYFVSNVISNRDDLLLQTPESLWARFRIDVRVKTMVTAIDRRSRIVTVKNFVSGEESTETYDKLVISTGAKPRILDIPGIDRALTLRNVIDADHVKAAVERATLKTAAIIGAGFIGVELAENLAHMGIETTLIHRGESILSMFDLEMIEPMQAVLEQNGIKLVLGAQPVEVTETEVVLESGERVSAGLVFSAAGVVPDNSLANAAGLEIGATGGLKVNHQQRTSDPNIFAAGDAVEKHGLLGGSHGLVPLANLANRHGRLLADAIAGVQVESKWALGTAIIGAFGFAAALTGLSEKAAIAQGLPHSVIHLHPGSHAGYYPGAKRVSIKVLFDPVTGRLLGAQAIGFDGADKRIDVLATAIYAGLTVDDLMDLELAYAPQFGSAKDAVNQAGYVGNNVFNGTTPTTQWYQLSQELQNGAQLIDVRTAAEFAAGSIPGAINIDVNQLRDNLERIADANVIVHCAVGQRGHIATQILRGYGKKVRNLDGGYTTWLAGTSALQRASR
jgi:NADPH-dependent 2,4-dienoyl-CoA reductase/sulfur reductase-like enzyme/rhodanese-related sulfurtransferase